MSDESKTIEALRERVAALEVEKAELQEALIWCSGSADFGCDGKAREGWLKMCAPLLSPAALSAARPKGGGR